MIKINIAEAKANFSRYIESVERGETVTVCRRNVPVAEIRPLPRPRSEKRPVGIDRGMKIPADFFEYLPFDESGAAHDALLPAHHNDPFDRGLVSQAILNGLAIVTPDAQIARYPAPVIW